MILLEHARDGQKVTNNYSATNNGVTVSMYLRLPSFYPEMYKMIVPPRFEHKKRNVGVEGGGEE